MPGPPRAGGELGGGGRKQPERSEDHSPDMQADLPASNQWASCALPAETPSFRAFAHFVNFARFDFTFAGVVDVVFRAFRASRARFAVLLCQEGFSVFFAQVEVAERWKC